MSKRMTKTKVSKAKRTAEKRKRHPSHPIAMLEAGSPVSIDEKEDAAMKTDQTMVVSMGSPPAGISQPPVDTSPEVMSSEPSTSSRREGDAQGTVNTPEGPTGDEGEILELLAFQLADEEYAFDILMIKEIIRSLEITRVPRRPPVIKGIISLRGTIIPIYDLRTRLGLTESPPTRNTRILVVELDKGRIGIIADRVTEVVKVKQGEVEPPPATGDGMSSGHLKGVTRVSGRLIILLDLTKAITL